MTGKGMDGGGGGNVIYFLKLLVKIFLFLSWVRSWQAPLAILYPIKSFLAAAILVSWNTA
jgi:hypothetical protein